MDKEIWKDVKGYEGYYQVSNLGRVKSLCRVVDGKSNSKRTLKERILKINLSTRGYPQVKLLKYSKCRTIPVHQLVAIAFLGHKPNGYKLVVNHINYDKTDNRLENIELVTQRQNANKKHIKSSSKYTGVHYDKRRKKKWISSIYYNGRTIQLGSFDDQYEAHLAYEYKLKSINKRYRKD